MTKLTHSRRHVFQKLPPRIYHYSNFCFLTLVVNSQVLLLKIFQGWNLKKDFNFFSINFFRFKPSISYEASQMFCFTTQCNQHTKIEKPHTRHYTIVTERTQYVFQLIQDFLMSRNTWLQVTFFLSSHLIFLKDATFNVR